jgi:hypothetical protein
VTHATRLRCLLLLSALTVLQRRAVIYYIHLDASPPAKSAPRARAVRALRPHEVGAVRSTNAQEPLSRWLSLPARLHSRALTLLSRGQRTYRVGPCGVLQRLQRVLLRVPCCLLRRVE